MRPNPSVNADAPVHGGDWASVGGGAPVTLVVRRRGGANARSIAALTCNYNVVTMVHGKPPIRMG